MPHVDPEPSTSPAADAPKSALRTINDAARALERLLLSLTRTDRAQQDVMEIAADLEQAVTSAPELALASILLGQIAARYAVRHCVETAILAILVARTLERPPAQVGSTAAAALTMNAGMLGYHEQYQSRRSELSADEVQTIHRHPQESVDLLMQAGVTDQDWLAYVLQHHENTDGSGYPCGSFDIEPNALIVSFADRYCAAVSARNYRRSQLPDQVWRELFVERRPGRDAGLAACFAALLGPYPPGTRVRLHNGEIGVVTARAGVDGPALHVMVLADAAGEAYAAPQTRFCTSSDHAVAAALHEDRADIRFSMKQLWGDAARLS